MPCTCCITFFGFNINAFCLGRSSLHLLILKSSMDGQKTFHNYKSMLRNIELHRSEFLTSQSQPRDSVDRCWNKKQPKCLKSCPKSSPNVSKVAQKVAQMFQKLDKSRLSRFYLKYDIFLNRPNKQVIFYFVNYCKKMCCLEGFKNRPIWSHCLAEQETKEYRPFCVTRLGNLLDFGQLFYCLWQQLICPNLSHSQAFFVKVSKSIIFGQLLQTFSDFFWSHCDHPCSSDSSSSSHSIGSGIIFQPKADLLRTTLRIIGRRCFGVQCDQNLQKFATLAKVYKTLANI